MISSCNHVLHVCPHLWFLYPVDSATAITVDDWNVNLTPRKNVHRVFLMYFRCALHCPELLGLCCLHHVFLCWMKTTTVEKLYFSLSLSPHRHLQPPFDSILLKYHNTATFHWCNKEKGWIYQPTVGNCRKAENIKKMSFGNPKIHRRSLFAWLNHFIKCLWQCTSAQAPDHPITTKQVLKSHFHNLISFL